MIVAVANKYPRFYGIASPTHYDIMYVVPKADAPVMYVSVNGQLTPTSAELREDVIAGGAYKNLSKPDWGRLAKTWDWGPPVVPALVEAINDCCRS